MVIRSIRKGGRYTKTEMIKRSERESLSKSAMLRTSVKKLMPLARQIAGKTVDDALLQMRFSKKKAAVAVRKHLEYARDEAIVTRGMGLGLPSPNPKVRDPNAEAPAKIVTKDGKHMKIADATRMYIDQAWVGRGTPGYDRDYRAKGRSFRLINPRTSITVLLKEDRTRVRLHNEREEKRANKKPWVQLPNRPVVQQNGYYSW